jgi:hypothetical protein
MFLDGDRYTLAERAFLNLRALLLAMSGRTCCAAGDGELCRDVSEARGH